MRVQAKKIWTSLPATLSTNYWIFFSFVLVHGAIVSTIVQGTNTLGRSWGKLWTEWGQSATFIVAVVAICHVLYSFTRLFTSEAVTDRAQIIQAVEVMPAWALSARSWWTWQPWKTLHQRSPFGKVPTGHADQLLFHDALLHLDRDRRPNLGEEEKDKLWKELMDGFKWNDREGIMDCLVRGAPIDRLNEDGEFPIHLGARLGDLEILMWSQAERNLLLKNSLHQTPLEIAVNASKHEAIRWIMERLPQTQVEASKAVFKAFDMAIIAEKEDVLKIIKHLWPAWQEWGLLSLCIGMGKSKAYTALLDPAIIKSWDEIQWSYFRLAFKAKSKMLVQRVVGIERDLWTQNDMYKAMETTLKNTELLNLLFGIGVNANDVISTFVINSNKQHMVGGLARRRYRLVKAILRKDIPLTPMILDRSLTFCPKLGAKIRNQLRKRGARNWRQIYDAARKGSFGDLISMLESEKDEGCRQRASNVAMPVRNVLRTRNPEQEKFQCIEHLLKLGLPVHPEDIQAACSFRISVRIFLLIIETGTTTITMTISNLSLVETHQFVLLGQN